MPKRRRRQQHLNQRPTRRKAPADTQIEHHKPKPPFPMNLFTSTNAFMFVGLFVMIGGLLFTFVLAQGTDVNPLDTAETPPTATPTANPDATATPTVREIQRFDEPDQVIEPGANDYRATFETEKGIFVIDLFDDIAPDTVNSFVFLAEEGFFDGTTFHREVLPDQGLDIIQGGDPTGSGRGGPGYEVEEEENDLLNERGTVAMAKAPGASTFGSQFFINRRHNSALDEDNNRFYPFGEVVEGMDVVDELTEGDRIERVAIDELPDEDGGDNGSADDEDGGDADEEE